MSRALRADLHIVTSELPLGWARSGNQLKGDVPGDLFALLCRVDRFNLSSNPGLNRKTVAGYLACGLTNLKDATAIRAGGKGLTGVFGFQNSV